MDEYDIQGRALSFNGTFEISHKKSCPYFERHRDNMFKIEKTCE